MTKRSRKPIPTRIDQQQLAQELVEKPPRPGWPAHSADQVGARGRSRGGDDRAPAVLRAPRSTSRTTPLPPPRAQNGSPRRSVPAEDHRSGTNPGDRALPAPSLPRQVLAELFDVSARTIGTAPIEIRPLLEQHGYVPTPAAGPRFSTAAAPLTSVPPSKRPKNHRVDFSRLQWGTTALPARAGQR